MDLGNKAPALCLWCFDLLHLNGVRITLPLVDRKALLADLVAMVGDKHSAVLGRFRRSYRVAAHLPENEFEGIVSKRREFADRSGPTKDWLKVKTSALRTAGVGNCSPPTRPIRNTPARDPVGVFYYRSACRLFVLFFADDADLLVGLVPGLK